METAPITPETEEPKMEQLNLDILKPGDVIKLDTPYKYVRLVTISATEGEAVEVVFNDAPNDNRGIDNVEWPSEGRRMRLKGLCPKISVVEGIMQVVQPTDGMIEVGKHAWLEKPGIGRSDSFVTGLISEIAYEPS